MTGIGLEGWDLVAFRVVGVVEMCFGGRVGLV